MQQYFFRHAMFVHKQNWKLKWFYIAANQGKNPQQRYTIEEFHNRSKLFSCTQTNKLFQKSPNPSVQDKKQETHELKLISHRPPSAAKKSNRVQSAKCRIEGNWKLDNNDSNHELYHSNLNSSHLESSSNNKRKDSYCNEYHDKQIIPFNGKPMPVFDVGDNAPFPTYNFQEKKNMKYVGKTDKPFTFKNEGNLMNFREYVSVPEKENQPAVKEKARPSSAKCSRVKTDKTDNIIPVVFNLTTNQQVYGEETDSKCSSKQETCYKLATSDGLLNSINKEERIKRYI